MLILCDVIQFISEFCCILIVNMKLRLRHNEKTVPLELNNETTLNMLKLQAQDCFNIMFVPCLVVCAVI